MLVLNQWLFTCQLCTQLKNTHEQEAQEADKQHHREIMYVRHPDLCCLQINIYHYTSMVAVQAAGGNTQTGHRETHGITQCWGDLAYTALHQSVLIRKWVRLVRMLWSVFNNMHIMRQLMLSAYPDSVRVSRHPIIYTQWIIAPDKDTAWD